MNEPASHWYIEIPAKLAGCLLILSLLLLALLTALYMYFGGGFGGRIAGVNVLVADLRPPLHAVAAALMLWMLLRPGKLQERAESAPHTALAWGIGAATALLLSGLKLWQHYELQTCAYDLAIHASVAWNVANGHGIWDSLQQNCYLADHFSLLHLLLTPLMRWAQSDVALVLLLVQCVALGLALPALYLLCLHHLPQKWLAPAFTILLVFNPYFHRISVQDFHPVALASPLFMWIMYCADTDRWGAVLVLSALALLVTDTVVLPLAGAGLYFAIFYPRRRVFGWLLCAVATAWFVAAVALWMPSFRGEGADHPSHLNRYSNLGGTSISSIARNLAQHPWVLLREIMQPDKIWGLHLLLLSVGYLPLLAPRAALLMLVPVLCMSLSGNEVQYRYLEHHSSVVLPFMFYAAIAGIQRFREFPRGRPMLPLLVGLLLIYDIYNIPPYLGNWSPTHVTALHQLMAKVPPLADVCSTQHLLTHMCARERACVLGAAVGPVRLVQRPAFSFSSGQGVMGRLTHPGAREDSDIFAPKMVWTISGSEISTYPWIQSDYLLLDDPQHMQDETSAFPMTPQSYSRQYTEIRASPDYELIDEKDGAVLLRRRPKRYGRFSHPPPLITE